MADLKEKPRNLLVIIEGDTNDADSVSESTMMNMEQLEYLLSLLQKLANYTVAGYFGKPRGRWESIDTIGTLPWCSHEHGGNIEREDVIKALGEEDYEYLSQLIPYGEYGVHTIGSVTVYEVAHNFGCLINKAATGEPLYG